MNQNAAVIPIALVEIDRLDVRSPAENQCAVFTVNLAERKLSLLTDHVELLRAAFREIRQSHPFTIATRSIFGNYPPDWAGDQASDGRDYGER